MSLNLLSQNSQQSKLHSPKFSKVPVNRQNCQLFVINYQMIRPNNIFNNRSQLQSIFTHIIVHNSITQNQNRQKFWISDSYVDIFTYWWHIKMMIKSGTRPLMYPSNSHSFYIGQLSLSDPRRKQCRVRNSARIHSRKDLPEQSYENPKILLTYLARITPRTSNPAMGGGV